MSLFDNFNANYRKLNRMIKNNDIAGIVKLLNTIDEDEKDYYLIEGLIADKFGMKVNIKLFLKLFNEEGKINYNLDNIRVNRELLINDKIKNIMIKIDPDWEKNFSDIQRKYIKLSLNKPIYDELMDFFDNIVVSDYLESFFDGNGFTKEFYDFVFTNCNSIKDISKILLKVPDTNKNCNDLEIKLLKMPEKFLDTYQYFLWYRIRNNNPLSRDELSKYFNGKEFTQDYYKEIMFSNIDNLDKYKEHYNELQIAFIKKFNGNIIANKLFWKCGVTADNLGDYFYIDGSELKISKKGFRILFNEKQWGILEKFSLSYEMLSQYGLNDNELSLFKYYNNIGNFKYKESFIKIISEKSEIFTYSEEDLNKFLSLFNLMSKKLDESNSSELVKFKSDIIIQLMKSEKPEIDLNLINDIYSKNNLPDVGKAYLVFKLLHPDYSAFNLDDESLASPILKKTDSDLKKDILIYSDLIKCAMGSNNRSIREYLKNIKDGNELFLRISNGEIKFADLNVDEKHILKIFVAHLNTLYNNSRDGKLNHRKLSGNIESDLNEVIPLFKTTNRYDLPDRIVRMFCYYAGVKSFDEAIRYLDSKREYGDVRGRINAKKIESDGLLLEEGDFIKGLGKDGMKYFSTILQNGSVAKEFLCIGASSDKTPLDTDLCKIIQRKNSLIDELDSTLSGVYGPIWFVMRNDDRFVNTRDSDGETIGNGTNKMEIFQSLRKDHYGIRTGFPSSEIDYIIVDNGMVDDLLPQIKHEISLNGFYIPVVDSKSGKLVFEPKEYDELRNKMSGLKKYGGGDFNFSDNLVFDEEIKKITNEVESYISDADKKRNKINEVVAKVLNESGISFGDKFDYDISTGSGQLIDTGSTGRGTSTGKSSDFDFILRIDSSTDQKELRDKIIRALGGEAEDMSNIRIKGANIGLEELVDIDISFVRKSESNYYSTDNALKDRLEQIKKQDYEKYKEVVANIIFAKKFLKDNKVYKPEHSRDQKEGGLGGVGVENWILQNGGSFLDAAGSFYDAAKGKTFDKFKKEYKIWDDGVNFYTGRYDEFVSSNMTEKGYKKMVEAIEKYLIMNKKRENGSNSNSYSFSNDRFLTSDNIIYNDEHQSRGR